MGDNLDENSFLKSFNNFKSFFNTIVIIVTICGTLCGFGYWIGCVITKHEYLQIITESKAEGQKELQDVKGDLLECKIENTILESKLDDKNEKTN